jgi:hypothetical protein
VLWPLAQFDQQTHDNRIIPFFWGSGARPADDYRVGFPFYWHFGHPLDDKVGGLDALFPLWSVNRHGTNSSSVYAPWPLIHFMHKGKESGWHVFPLAGSYGDGNEYFRFQAAFLADQWGNQREDRHGSMVLPLYGYERHKQDWNFYSLPWSGGQMADHRWQFVPPALFYHRTNTTGSLTLSPLWLHNSSANPADGGWSVLLPLFYHGYGAEGSSTLSPLWLAHTSTNPQNTSWQALIPVFYHGSSQESDLLLTPVWSQGAHSNVNWQFLLPLYYARQAGQNKFWATPVGGLRTTEGQKTWMIYPLLSWGQPRAGGGEFWALAPLVHADWNASNSVSHVIPFYYSNSDTRTFVSLAWSRWYGAQTTNSVVPPLLSWMSSDAASSDLYYALGLGKFSWGETSGSQWLFPIFYHDRREHTFLSPVWAQWPASDGGTNTCWPFTFSWMTEEEKRNTFWLLLGLGKFSWGAMPGSSYLLPIYYSDPRTDEFYSLIYGRKPDDFTYYATPLVGKREGSTAGSWVFPLYSHKRDVKTDDVDDWLLWGNHWERGGVSRSVMFPLFGYHNFGPRDSEPKANQRWAHYGKDFFCIPFCWYNNESFLRPSSEEFKLTSAARRNKTAPPPPMPLVREDKFGHGIFPLWSYKNVEKPAEGRSNVDGSFLLCLYDYNREVGPLAKAPAGTKDYTRARVLWRLWHYERLNGEVSVDVFPGFTYDRKNDGYKKISWLWRFFRYERDKDGGRKLDLLFIPLMRSEGGTR